MKPNFFPGSSEDVERIYKAVKEADLTALAQLPNQSPNLRNEKGFSIVHWAVVKTNCSNVNEMLPILKWLINSGYNVNLPYTKTGDYYKNYGPLHSAVRRKQFEVAALLLNHGADTSLVDSKNKNPIDWAKEFTDDRGKEILSLLSRHTRFASDCPII